MPKEPKYDISISVSLIGVSVTMSMAKIEEPIEPKVIDQEWPSSEAAADLATS